MYRQPYYSVGSRNSRSTTIYAVSSRSTTQVVPIVLPPCAGPPGCSPLHPLRYLSSLSIIIGMPNRSCKLELRSNQCFVCNFLSILKRKSSATHIKRKFLPIDYKISFGDKWYGKSCSLSSIQHKNQNAAAYGC